MTRKWLLCAVIGHDYEEHREYEDSGYSAVHVETWRQCRRCEHFRRVWHIRDEANTPIERKAKRSAG